MNNIIKYTICLNILAMTSSSVKWKMLLFAPYLFHDRSWVRLNVFYIFLSHIDTFKCWSWWCVRDSSLLNMSLQTEQRKYEFTDRAKKKTMKFVICQRKKTFGIDCSRICSCSRAVPNDISDHFWKKISLNTWYNWLVRCHC